MNLLKFFGSVALPGASFGAARVGQPPYRMALCRSSNEGMAVRLVDTPINLLSAMFDTGGPGLLNDSGGNVIRFESTGQDLANFGQPEIL